MQSFQFHIFRLKNNICVFVPSENAVSPAKSVDYLRLMMLTKPRKFVSAQIVVIMSTVHGYTSCPKFSNDIIGKTCMNDLSDIIIILDTPHIRIISIDCMFLAEILWWIF